MGGVSEDDKLRSKNLVFSPGVDGAFLSGGWSDSDDTQDIRRSRCSECAYSNRVGKSRYPVHFAKSN